MIKTVENSYYFVSHVFGSSFTKVDTYLCRDCLLLRDYYSKRVVLIKIDNACKKCVGDSPVGESKSEMPLRPGSHQLIELDNQPLLSQAHLHGGEFKVYNAAILIAHTRYGSKV